MISPLLGLAGAVLLVAGPVMIARGLTGRRSITQELTNQKITFPAHDVLPAELARHAGAQVHTGDQARVFSDLIAAHVTQATGGRTYSEIADEWLAAGRKDERLARLRETAFMGQALRGSLLAAYQAWQISALVIGLGALFATIGLIVLALAINLR